MRKCTSSTFLIDTIASVDGRTIDPKIYLIGQSKLINHDDSEARNPHLCQHHRACVHVLHRSMCFSTDSTHTKANKLCKVNADGDVHVVVVVVATDALVVVVVL